MNEKLIDLNNDNELSQLTKELLTSMFVKDAIKVVELCDNTESSGGNSFNIAFIAIKYIQLSADTLLRDYLKDARFVNELLNTPMDEEMNEKALTDIVEKYTKPIMIKIRKESEGLANE